MRVVSISLGRRGGHESIEDVVLRESVVGARSYENQLIEDVVFVAVVLRWCCGSQSIEEVMFGALVEGFGCWSMLLRDLVVCGCCAQGSSLKVML